MPGMTSPIQCWFVRVKAIVNDIYTGPQLCGKSNLLMPPVAIEYTGSCTDSTLLFAISKGTGDLKGVQRFTDRCI